ncbi:hypothetical protein [Rufibacter quisquiliarum]|uniref:YbbR-like domain-containing protein n=1 Tax=Rufibacter quisquiliarum TaxID=1549639 RepID=A0A839GVI8_9BACT|nr:hypothetical protein [Rufibacter quisquiliarum]MBA9078448.1 hypothetical protein [Rufibacter quisquiliarum]
MLCFFTAATFWLLNALNKNYTTLVSYPIQFAYDPRQLVPVKPLPEEVTISVTGKGWKLLRKNLQFQVQPAILTIRGLPYVKSVPGTALRPAISSVLDGLALNFVATDSIAFDFDRLVTRKVPITVDSTQLQIDSGFAFAGPIVIRPDSVTFVGPERIIEQFPSPYPLAVPTASLKAPYKGELSLTHDFTKLVKADVSEAEVEFNVLALERQEVAVPPLLQNFPPGYRLRLVNGPVRVQYAFLPKHREQIQPELFQVVLDYQKFNAADSTIVPVVSHKPPLVRQVAVLPARVHISLTPQ